MVSAAGNTHSQVNTHLFVVNGSILPKTVEKASEFCVVECGQNDFFKNTTLKFRNVGKN